MSSFAAGEFMHVLAVDDSSVDRTLIATLLRSSKHRVTTVDSGKRALELLDLESDVNMIITDYWMPEMTGYELLKKVKESSALRQIPVVIMSSENIPTRINKGGSRGLSVETGEIIGRAPSMRAHDDAIMTV